MCCHIFNGTERVSSKVGESDWTAVPIIVGGDDASEVSFVGGWWPGQT
jgi:hypothetical protein